MRLPLVLQDGTCNGLQHYAALARDSGCGAAVNLLPADRPQDVYQVGVRQSSSSSSGGGGGGGCGTHFPGGRFSLEAAYVAATVTAVHGATSRDPRHGTVD